MSTEEYIWFTNGKDWEFNDVPQTTISRATKVVIVWWANYIHECRFQIH